MNHVEELCLEDRFDLDEIESLPAFNVPAFFTFTEAETSDSTLCTYAITVVNEIPYNGVLCYALSPMGLCEEGGADWFGIYGFLRNPLPMQVTMPIDTGIDLFNNYRFSGSILDALNTTFNPAVRAMTYGYEAGTGQGMQYYNSGDQLTGWQRVGSGGLSALYTAGTIGVAVGLEQSGAEITFGRNVRIAPVGNRTGNPLGERPHYHRRGVGAGGETQPGQGIGRHRPWETKSTDTSFWNRF